MTEIIRQTVIFPVPPQVVYDAIMDEKQHAVFTGAKARIDQSVGGKFTAWDGYIDGTNLELIPGKKIVQKWHAADWEEGIYSTVTFTFSPDPKGTKMEFTHEGVPIDQFDDINKGWYENYWDLMQNYFRK
jgi:activator of HSP90 ATPase